MAPSTRIAKLFPPRLFVITTTQRSPDDMHDVRDERYCGVPWCWTPPAEGKDSRGNAKLYCAAEHSHLEL